MNTISGNVIKVVPNSHINAISMKDMKEGQFATIEDNCTCFNGMIVCRLYNNNFVLLNEIGKGSIFTIPHNIKVVPVATGTEITIRV